MAWWDRVHNWFRTVAQEEKAADFTTLLYQPWQAQHGMARPDYRMDKATLNAYSWVYACRRLIAQEVAKRPLRLYRGEGRNRKEVTSGPLYSLLGYINPRKTPQGMIEETVEDLVSTGNAYWQCVGSTKNIMELWRLRADMITVVPGANWVEAYLFGQPPKQKRYEAQDIIPFSLPNVNSDFYGLPPVVAAKLAIESDYAAALANKALLDRGFRPDLLIKIKNRMDDEQRLALQRSFQRRHEGVNSGVHVLEEMGDIEATPVGFSPRDMEFPTLRHSTAIEICGIMGMPPMLVGVEGSQTFANYGEAEKQFQAKTVGYYCGNIEGSINEFIVPLMGDKTLVAEFDDSEVDALQESDLQDKAVALQELGSGALTHNEYRAEYYPNLPQLPPEVGDVTYVPLNWIPAGQAVAEPGPVPPQLQLQKSLGAGGGGDGPFVGAGSSGRRMTDRRSRASGR